MITLHLDHKPTAWAAPQRCKNIYFNPKHKQKKEVIRLIQEQYSGPPLTGYVSVSMVFQMAIPKSASKKKQQLMASKEIRPTNVDASNCFKFYEDCLKNIVMDDDRYVARMWAIKIYGIKDHVTIFIEKLEADNANHS
jgi:Holliday junction resolvase RusA-like endonuclease